jgi:zinc-ribbon domain
MYCPSCGALLAQQVKFCNRCGSQLTTPKEVELIKLFEKRMDSEMEGLFWIIVMGIGMVFGGSALLRIVHLSEWIILTYMIVSCVALLSYFGLGVWQIRRLAHNLREESGGKEFGPADIHQLEPDRSFNELESLPSVTENTTQTLEAGRTKTTREPVI